MSNRINKILLISPTWVNLHRDISLQLEKMGYDVTFIPETSFPEDSYRVKGKKKTVDDEISETIKTRYWTQYDSLIRKHYDYLLVIDGQGINHYLFDILKLINPNIYCVNYLYDTTHSVYHFEKNFKYFSKVFTFDRQESEKYGIELLPIYWTPIESEGSNSHFDIFGFGAYSKSRFELYKFIYHVGEKLGKNSFIHVYHDVIQNKALHSIKNIFRRLMGKNALISVADYKSELIIHTLLSSENFRQMIQSSEVVIDSKVLEQDGLTARFMWALGAGKKIITTNSAAKLYPFYTKEQILILDENRSLASQTSKVVQFIESAPFEMTSNCRKIIEGFRIDNWISTILSVNNDL